jgi:hypothetical protein
MADDLVTRLRSNSSCKSDIGCADDLCQEAADRIEQLEAALRPFALAANLLDEEGWDDLHIEGSNADVTGKHCRNARAALAGEKKDD